MTHTPASVTINIDDINSFRERSNSPSKASFRSSSVLSKASSISYFERMEIKNNLSEKNLVKPINSSQLSYNDNNSKDNFVSRMTDLGLKET